MLQWKQSLPIFPTYVRKVRPRARPGPSCRPSGQPGSQASWPAKELVCLAMGKRYLKEGISRENSEAAGTSGEKVASRSYQHLSLTFTYLYEPRLLHSIKGQFHEMFIQFSVLGSTDLKSQPYYSNISGVNFVHLTLFLILYFSSELVRLWPYRYIIQRYMIRRTRSLVIKDSPFY